MKNQTNSRSILHRLPVLTFVALVGLCAPVLFAGTPEAPAPFPSHDSDGQPPNSALPALVHRVEPVCPAAASTGEDERCVYVAFVVDAEGRVKNPRVMYACAPEAERAALAALEQWKFTAGKLSGRPVSTQMTVALRLKAEPQP